MSIERYGFEIMVDGNWQAVTPHDGQPPYCFDTELEAWTMARIFYPELVRLAKTGNKDLIRVGTGMCGDRMKDTDKSGRARS